METNPTYQIDLITRYLAGEATGDDLLFLAEWLKADPGHRKAFEEYRRLWMKMEQVRMEDTMDVDAAWKEVETRITDHGTRYTEHEARETSSQHPETTYGIRHTKNRFFVGRYHQLLRLAAVILLFAVPSYLAYRYLSRPEQKQLTATRTILEGKLPDGTAVTLNTGATLEFPASFRKSDRKVKLSGEAWFEVKHENARPFIILRDKIRVEVLGTTFYVNTDAGNGRMEVILNSGSVAVYYEDQPGERIILAPGEKASISLDLPHIEKDVNTDQNYRAWMTKRFIYNHAPLETIIADLNKVYHSNLKIMTPAVSRCLVTATFDNQTVESILHVLGATLDLHITSHGSWTEITGNRCN
jgi:transmembrane sensor